MTADLAPNPRWGLPPSPAALREAQSKLLALAGSNGETEATLDEMVRVVESALAGLNGRILLLSDAGDELIQRRLFKSENGAPGAIASVSVGLCGATCGKAAFTGRRAVSSDVVNDELWVDYADEARANNIRAAWSEPVFAPDGSLLGTFALVSGVPRAPRSGESQLHELAARLVGMVLNRNVTAQRHEKDALRRAKEAAEFANAAKSRFLADMSHEIRTPMTAIVGYAEALLDERQLPEELRTQVRTIVRNGEHLVSLINDILDLSKIEAGGVELRPEPCSPGAVARDVVALFGRKAQEKGVALAVEVEGLIPAQIRVDPMRLRQILLNLVGNAVKFTDEGAVRLSLRTDAKRERIVFDVIDTGVGIDAASIERIFEPFMQADVLTTRRFGGTGLGLAICKRLAEALGGDIHAQSRPGEGSRFTLALPAGPLGDAKMVGSVDAAPADGPAERRLSGELLGARVLLVEDGDDSRRLLTHILRRVGAEVDATVNGAEGVEAAMSAWRSGAPFDVILMDMQMPVMDGYEATRRLRTQGCDIPIIALTAHAMEGDREMCLDAGCDGYLAKPVRRDVLVDACARRLRRAQRKKSA